MAANFTRPGEFAEDGDASASGGPPMHAARPAATATGDHVARHIGTEPLPPPPMFDTGLGQTFFQMRTRMSVSVWDMARLVGSEPTVIANLEAGALDALPAWTELTRIVETYGALTGTDTGPLLTRLIKAYALTGPAVTQPITAHLPQQAPAHAPVADVDEIVPYSDTVQTNPRPVARKAGYADAEDVEDDAGADDGASSGRKRRGRSAAIALACALALLFGAVLAARMQPRILYAAAWPWPQTVRQPLVAGIDWLVLQLAPKREGLIWIDAGNPAWRKTDKLPEPKP